MLKVAGANLQVDGCVLSPDEPLHGEHEPLHGEAGAAPLAKACRIARTAYRRPTREDCMLRKLTLALALVVGVPSLVTAQEAVICKDGTTGRAGRGACSHHGGVAKSTTAPPTTPATAPPGSPPVAPPPAQPPASHAPSTGRAPSQPPVAGQPTARCKDGTMSYSKHHSGSCSHHGGVAQWLQ
jgi:hypothetical protein